MSGISLLILLLHGIIVLITTVTLIFSKDIRVVILAGILVLLVFIQTIIFDGCVLSMFEPKVPIINTKATSFLRNLIVKISKALGITSMSNIKDNDLEQILVGITVVAFILKLISFSIPGFNDMIPTLHFIPDIFKYINMNTVPYIADVFAVPMFLLLSLYFYNRYRTRKLTFIEKFLFTFSVSGAICDIFFVYILPFIDQYQTPTRKNINMGQNIRYRV